MAFEIAIGCNVRKSPYFEATVADGVVSFSVYNHMLAPAHFGDPEREYRALSENVVMWDVACERQVELAGPDAERLMRYLTPRDISATVVGQGKYVPICDYDGLLINDPVLQKLSDDCFWLSIADSDILLWAKAIAAERRLDVRVSEPDASPLGVQGPRADDVVAELFGDWVRGLRHFRFQETKLGSMPILLARSGWSKQAVSNCICEIPDAAPSCTNELRKLARHSASSPAHRATLNAWKAACCPDGADARYNVNPFEAGLGAFVDLDRDDDFVGKAALRRIAEEGVRRRRVGYVIGGDRINGISEWHDVKLGHNVVGKVTEAVYSPRLGKNIAVGLLASEIGDDEGQLATDFDDGPRSVTVCGLPFLK
ncbi:MAG: glycine cleavage T C-terminal barrel domain-containing protein [Woeseiaceae bacterium]|nr:glycine cleavage T C-terminal barrel domain-containing protein [Woeseiaceae bacterium]